MFWAIQTFDTLRLSYVERPCGTRLSDDSRKLIGLLAVHHGRNMLREDIVHIIWGADYDRPHQHRLSNCLWRLNRFRGPDGAPLKHSMLHIDRTGEVRLEPDSVTWLDLAEFERIQAGINVTAANLSRYDVSLIEKAVTLYRGDLLSDLDVDWILEPRNHAQQCYLDMLQMLIDHYSMRTAHGEVITYASRYIETDPYVEHVHAALIGACLASGRRSLAAAHAESCRRALVDDLSEPLGPELQRLIADANPSSRRKLHRGSPSRSVSIGHGDKVEQLQATLVKLLKTCETLLDELRDDATRR